MKTQHNDEIYCTNSYLNKFLSKMKKLDNYDDFKIIIVSDHGARNSSEPKDSFSVAALVKDTTQQPFIDKKIISVQKIVSDFFNQEKISSSNFNKYYDYETQKFLDINFD